ncbi:S26 family signal peptidase [Streptomyces sp. NPDC048717]|uniref:S26 family signal peptidase n=1 Tax=Streptomyces sp. NPDC048717 TaxID=3154928 RepID=UPI0034462E49
MVAGSVTGLAVMACAAAFLLRRRCALLDVSGSSMMPTYRDGDRLFALKVPARLMRRGTVVAIRMRTGDADGVDGADGPVRDATMPGGLVPTTMIKRLAALPGDRIPGSLSPADVVPARHVYVLGDNREASYDSRQTGPVPFDRLTAVVLGRTRRGAATGIADHGAT